MTSLDVKGAFLYAPLPAEADPVIVRPPAAWHHLGVITDRNELWIVNKALYDLRISPRAWSLYRDSEIPKLQIPLKSSANPMHLKWVRNSVDHGLWHLRNSDEQATKLHGFLVVYFDDFLILACPAMADAVTQAIRSLSGPQLSRVG